MTGARPTSVHFSRPPVVELAIAVEFLPVVDLGAVLLSDLVGGWRSEYPHISESAADLPTAGSSGGHLVFSTGFPGVRLRLASGDGSLLVQVQNGKLILNWHQRGEQADYPEFPAVRERFDRLWSEVVSYLGDLGGEQPLPVVAEVTYVNVIRSLPGDGPAAAFTVVALDAPLTAASAFRFQHRQALAAPAATGELTVTAEPVPGEEGAHYLTVSSQLRLDGTAAVTSVHGHLNRAHDLAVSAFWDATRPSYHRAWGAQT